MEEHFRRLRGDNAKIRGARPNWAKAFDKHDFNIHKLYSRTTKKFFEICEYMDPESLFMNDFLLKVFES